MNKYYLVYWGKVKGFESFVCNPDGADFLRRRAIQDLRKKHNTSDIKFVITKSLLRALYYRVRHAF